MKRRRSDRNSSVRVLIAHPSPDLYGADLQMLETVKALASAGMDVRVVVPSDGPLVIRLREAGASVAFAKFPVLRRADLSIDGLPRLVLDASRAVLRLRRLVRSMAPDVLFVNTITLPWWLVAGRLAGRRTVSHVHEAERHSSRIVRTMLHVPLLLAHRIVVNSKSTGAVVTEAVPRLAHRCIVIYNGVAEPTDLLQPLQPAAPHRLLVVGRLSPRKAPHIAAEAVRELVKRGHDVRLEIVGTPFTGVEWYEAELRSLAEEPELAGRVTFSGYCSPIWPVFTRSELVLAPSLFEALGNVVIEAQLAHRPVVASTATGHTESIEDGRTGLLVTPDDPIAMADAAERILTDPALAERLTEEASASARDRFGTARYASEMVALIRSLVDR